MLHPFAARAHLDKSSRFSIRYAEASGVCPECPRLLPEVYGDIEIRKVSDEKSGVMSDGEQSCIEGKDPELA